MRFLIDENVPKSVQDFLEERGHELLYAPDYFMPGSSDHLLAAIADREEAVVVTWNIKDFKQITSRAPRGSRARLRRMGWVAFKCNEASGRTRLEQEIDLIEFEYHRRQKRGDRRLFVEIMQTGVKINS